MWHKLLYLNFILYDVTLVTDLKKNKNILLYIMLYINFVNINVKNDKDSFKDLLKQTYI